MSRTTFLQSFDEKEEAQILRDEIRLKILKYGMAPKVTVGIRYMHGVGGYAVELDHEDNIDLLTTVLSGQL